MERLNFYPNKKLFAELRGGTFLQNRHKEAMSTREHFNNYERNMFGNEAALLPDDAWRMVDETTMRVMREDEGSVYMNDLPMRGVDIGKTASVYRRSSDLSNRVNITMNGQEPSMMDKVNYTFAGHPVPIFDTSYGLSWREYRGMQTEGFDGLSDDQEAAVANLEQVRAQYVLDGDTSINAGGYIGYGIKNHPETNKMDLDSSGFNIDLTSFATSSDDIENFFVRDFRKVMHDNLIMGGVTVYISPEIERRFGRSYSGSSGFKGGSLRDFLLSLEFIDDIKMTYELSGNEFMAYPLDGRSIRLLAGMATTTVAIPRVQAFDNFNFKVMSATGLEIRADANGRCAVIYGANTT